MAKSMDSTGGSGLPSMEKLDGNRNYATWKFLMELHLLHDDLWEFTSMKPDTTDIQGVRKDQRARAKICLLIKPHCLVHVRQAKSTKDAWESLKSAFEDKGLNNRCRLLAKLVSMKLEQFQTVREYVTSVMMVSQELQDLGKEVDDELLATLLLQGLTIDFQPMRLAIENSNVVLTTDYVKMKLFQMEDTYSASTSVSQPTPALLSNKSKGKSTQKKTKQKIKCFICDGPHKANVCPDNPKGKREALQAFAFGSSTPWSEDWIIDSGASTHMSNRKSWFKQIKDTPKPLRVTCADGNEVFGAGEGTVVCESGLTVNNVTYVPKLASSLLSVNAIAKKGNVIVFTDKGCDIYKRDECEVRGKAVVKGVEERGIYKIKCCSQGSALVTTEHDKQMLWHRRMGHLGMHNLKLLRDKMATGISFPDISSKLECISCIMGKQTKQPFRKTDAKRAKEVLGLVHSDVCGPMSIPSMSGFRYFLTFIDDLTRKTFIYFLKNKSEVFEKFTVFKAFAENQCGKKIKILRTDNGTEYVNKRMDDLLKKCGIQHQLTVEYTPEQNGVAERANRTICDKARTMLKESALGKRFWAEAVHHAVYLKNKSPTIAVKNVTPDEKWSGSKSDLSMLKTFGCKAFMHIPDKKRTKWDIKSRELIHTGFDDNAKAYRLVDPTSGKVFKARNVVFLENQKHKEVQKEFQEEPETMLLQDDTIVRNVVEPDVSHRQQEDDDDVNNVPRVEQKLESFTENTVQNEVVSNEQEDVEFQDCESDVTEDRPQEVVRRYPLRDRKPKEIPDHVLYHAVETEHDPTTVQDALSRPDSREWKAAIQEELDALKENGTWILVKPEQASNVVDSKWIFRIKEEAGNKRRYKARLVARGFSQRRGIDYDDTFSPVVRHSSLRFLLALAVKSGLNVDQMDVKTAFLNGDLSETVYMKQPDGYEEKGKEDNVCLLKRAIYGLKQSPRAWNNKLNKELLQLSFKRSKNEPCIYMRTQGKKIIILAVYVDDVLIFWNDVEVLRKVKRDLMSKFNMKDLGKAEHFLGMHITQNDIGIKVDQEKYVDKMLKVFGMADCKVASTPSFSGQKLSKPGPEHKPDPRIPYQNLIGSLMYISVCTRPDIAHAVNFLSQFNACYTEEHWIAAKRVLRYLKGTKCLGLQYRKTGKHKVQGYADASHATCHDRRSYSGIVFLHMGAAICWESRKQMTIALSTAEAEYVAMSEAAREAIFLKRLISEVSGEVEIPVKIFSDSQSAVAIAQNPVHHQRTKHIDVRHHFVREAVEHGHIELEYLETNYMVADALTKSLLKGKFSWCTLNMGVV